MALCSDCSCNLDGKSVFNGRCQACHAKYLVRDIAPSKITEYGSAPQNVEKLNLAREEEIRSILVTTEMQPDINIQKRITIITAECAYGMNIFKDLFAGVRNIVGGRSEAVQKTMRDARETVLYELKREAYLVGGNAVVAVDLDYVELAGTGSSMLMLVASGTAVRIAE